MISLTLIKFCVLGAVIVYSIYEGQREALYYHLKNVSGKLQGIDEHPIFLAQRVTFGIPVFILFVLISQDYWVAALKCVTLSMMFPFFHDGSYYLHRNNLDKELYKSRFWSMSYTSTAVTTFLLTPLNRTILFIIGLAVYLFI